MSDVNKAPNREPATISLKTPTENIDGIHNKEDFINKSNKI
jgi:hypothetical protein